MFKAMVLLKRRHGMSMKDFIHHYETSHALLGVKYQTKMTRYIRHYLHPLPYPLDGKVIEAEYDVLTELHFADKQAFDEGMALMLAPETNRILAEDEAKFLDLSRSRLVFVEEHESEIPGVDRNAMLPADAIKCMVLLKRKPGMSMDDFIHHYETIHAPLGLKYGNTMSRYVRYFLRPAPYPLDGSIVEAEYDVATLVCFNSRADSEKAAARMAEPEANRVISADEATFLNLETRRFMSVQDRESDLPWMR